MSNNKKDNFNKAMYDMFGVGGSTPQDGTAPAPAAAEPAPEPAKKFSVTLPDEVPSYTGSSRSTTYLAPGTYMEGTLKVNGDVEVAGDFKGEMNASGSIIIHSNINANVTASRVDLVSCKLVGDIHSSGSVTVDGNSSVEGNITGEDLTCAGSVQGDIRMSGNSTFQQSSAANGNITTGTMTMDRGASICGTLTMAGTKAAPHGSRPAPGADADNN